MKIWIHYLIILGIVGCGGCGKHEVAVSKDAVTTTEKDDKKRITSIRKIPLDASQPKKFANGNGETMTNYAYDANGNRVTNPVVRTNSAPTAP
jgi:hypothetical protein